MPNHVQSRLNHIRSCYPVRGLPWRHPVYGDRLLPFFVQYAGQVGKALVFDTHNHRAISQKRKRHLVALLHTEAITDVLGDGGLPLAGHCCISHYRLLVLTS